MLTSSDRVQMRANAVRLRNDRVAEIVLRRGAQELPAQPVRLVAAGSGRVQQGEAAQESRGEVLVLGDADLDIQTGDRFTDGGVLYRVVFVNPNRLVGTVATTEAAA